MSRLLLYGFSQHNYSTTFSPAGLCFVFLLSFSFIISYAGDQIKKVTVSGKRVRLLLPFGGRGTCLPRKGICKSTTWDFEKHEALMLKYLLKLKEQTRKVPLFLCQASMKAMLLTWSLWKNMDFEELGECLPKMYSHITCQFCASKTVKLNVIKQLYPPFHLPSNSSVESKKKCQV